LEKLFVSCDSFQIMPSSYMTKLCIFIELMLIHL